MLASYLEALPLIAILRGIAPDEAEAVGDALFTAGFRVIEVPLNSPEPLASIRRLASRFGQDCLVGGGTVVDVAQIADIAAAGGRLVVSPHADTRVIAATAEAGLVSTRGVATPTEAFAAIAAGAHGLKLFPAELLQPAVVKAWRAVMPRSIPLLPVGGITPDNLGAYAAAGASGFGLGSALYKPGMTADTLGDNAEGFVCAWQALSPA